MPDVSHAVGEIAGALRAMFGLTRPSRLRTQMSETMDLYIKANGASLLGATGPLERLIAEQATQLLALGPGEARARAWAWGPFMAAVVFAAIAAIPGVFVWNASHHWWTWVLLVPDGAVVLLLFAVGIVMLLERKPATVVS